MSRRRSSSIRQLQLQWRDRKLLARTSTGKILTLPKFPLHQVQWLKTLTQQFAAKHNACMAVLLLLDIKTRQWHPSIPAQRCGRKRSQIKMESIDFTGFSAVLAGSFQSILGGTIQALAAVPAFDGLHLITTHSAGSLWVFVRAERTAALADPASIVVDDIPATLHAHADRLHLD